jgi:(p)ppGpp synthase/HD superfamily hydrolase
MPKVLMLNQRDDNLYYTSKQEDFRTLAIKAHGNQVYGPYPYAFHLSMVEDCLVANGYTDREYRAAAWLHDVLEDTEMKYETLLKFYGKEVADMVYACTGVGEDRNERNNSIYTKIKDCHKAAPVKVADRICNMRFGVLNKSTQLRKYIKEFPAFSKAIRPIMTETRQGALMWNTLEDIVVLSVR